MNKKVYSRNVIMTGFTSFFTDISSEMIYPLLQAFVAAAMISQKALLGPILGIIEGIAESTASLLKVLAGYYSDKVQKRKSPAIAGYGLSALSRILFFAASAGWGMILTARFFDKVGKGIRTAPRDALISESTPAASRGKAFGFQRGMDFAGAFLGSLICYFLVREFIDPVTKTLISLKSFYIIFAAALVPAFIGVIFLFFTKETGGRGEGELKETAKPNLNISRYDRNLKLLFLATIIFTLGNSSNQFLLLRSSTLGASLSTVILMYIIFNFTAGSLSPFFGSLSDRVGRRKLLMIGYGIYGLVYLCFGLIPEGSTIGLFTLWIVYGIFYAMTEGVEKAYVADMAPAGSRATALGFYHTIVGIGLLPASIIAGMLFTFFPSAPFIFGAGTSAITIIILLQCRNTR